MNSSATNVRYLGKEELEDELQDAAAMLSSVSVEDASSDEGFGTTAAPTSSPPPSSSSNNTTISLVESGRRRRGRNSNTRRRSLGGSSSSSGGGGADKSEIGLEPGGPRPGAYEAGGRAFGDRPAWDLSRPVIVRQNSRENECDDDDDDGDDEEQWRSTMAIQYYQNGINRVIMSYGGLHAVNLDGNAFRGVAIGRIHQQHEYQQQTQQHYQSHDNYSTNNSIYFGNMETGFHQQFTPSGGHLNGFFNYENNASADSLGVESMRDETSISDTSEHRSHGNDRYNWYSPLLILRVLTSQQLSRKEKRKAMALLCCYVLGIFITTGIVLGLVLPPLVSTMTDESSVGGATAEGSASMAPTLAPNLIPGDKTPSRFDFTTTTTTIPGANLCDHYDQAMARTTESPSATTTTASAKDRSSPSIYQQCYCSPYKISYLGDDVRALYWRLRDEQNVPQIWYDQLRQGQSNSSSPSSLSSSSSQQQQPIAIEDCTPQNLAFLQMVQHQQLHNSTTLISKERYGLMVLYHTTQGNQWHDDTNWLTALSVCEWFGVVCDDNSGTQTKKLHLLNNHLNGWIGPEVGLLQQFSEITLSDESSVELQGTLPSEIGRLSRLEQLDLRWSKFEGSLPTEIGLLSSTLEALLLESNHFSGQLPSEVGSLTKLTTLEIQLNKFTGIFPTTIRNLESLIALRARDNMFSGKIMSELGLLTNLRLISLARNRFLPGPWPLEWSSLTSLAHFYCEECAFTGTFPTGDLLKLTGLSDFRVTWNNFEGSIPTEIGTMTRLASFEVGWNRFDGTTLPTELGNLSLLRWLDIAGTNLVGTLPTELSNLSNLEFFLLHNNPDLSGNLTELCASTEHLAQRRHFVRDIIDKLWGEMVAPVKCPCCGHLR